MDPLSYQFTSVLISISIGIILGLIFDLYRISRGFIKPPWWLTQVGDIVFWLIATVVSFLILFKGNWGEVRPYVFISVTIGFYLYIKIISKKFQKLTLKLIYIIQKTIKLLIRIILFPIKLLQRIVLVPIGIITYIFQRTRAALRAVFKKILNPIVILSTKLKNKVRGNIVKFKNRVKLKLKSLLKKINPFKGKKKE